MCNAIHIKTKNTDSAVALIKIQEQKFKNILVHSVNHFFLNTGQMNMTNTAQCQGL